MTHQLSLFEAVTESFARAPEGELTVQQLYRSAAALAGIDPADFHAKEAIGEQGRVLSRKERAARFAQQTLKMKGLLERVPGRRGTWRLTKEGKHSLHRIERGVVLIGFSTRLGVALWADVRDAFAGLAEPVHLVLTSPPYALARPRAYGNPARHEYVDFICAALEQLLRHLAPGGSIVLNIGNDIFEPGTPARSLLQERLLIALHDRLGLHLMDRCIWFNRSKPPGPVQWASKARVQLNVAYEPVLWLTNDPMKIRADNRRVLQPHSERHQRLLKQGGTKTAAEHSDGRYNRPAGAFGNSTPGRIPLNVFDMGHGCPEQVRYKAAARAAGLPVHGAPMPQRLAEFFIQFLTEPGDLVAEPFAGSQTTAAAAERLGRRWISTDCMAEYVAGGALRFPGAWINPDLLSALA